MSTFASPLGSLTPGLVVLNSSGVSSGFSALGTTQYVVSTGANAYTTSAHVPQPSVTGLVQEIMYPVTYVATPATGTQLSVYNGAAVLCSATIQPLYANSIFSFEWNVTISTTGGTACLNAYEFTGPSPIGFSIALMTGAATNYIPTSGSVIGAWAYTTPLTFSLCVFSPTPASVSGSYSGNSDYCLISEYNTTGTVPTNITVTSTSATPVTLFTITGAVSTSVYIRGTVSYFDSVQLVGSMQTFQMLLQTPSSGSSTLAFNNVSSNSLALSPSLTAAIATNTLTIQVVGIASKTFECKATYTAVVA